MGIGKAWGTIFGSSDATKKTFKGLLFSFIPIMNVISHGYAVELMGNAAKGKEEMPVWGGSWDLFVKGVSAFMIYFAYLLLPYLIMVFINVASNSSLLQIIGYLLYLLFFFPVPISIAHYASTDKWGESFSYGLNISRIKPVIAKYLGTFALNVLFLLIVEFIVEIIVIIVGKAPVLRWVLSSVLNYLVLILFYYVYGEIYHSIQGNQPADTDSVIPA